MSLEDDADKDKSDFSHFDVVLTDWGRPILQHIKNVKVTPMSTKEFLSHCIPCGGDWGQMFLTGLRELYPSMYNLVPDHMGWRAFVTISCLLNLLGVDTSKG